jgi:2-methylisocitrate lyase-like PEP mutase family enzyme
MTSRSEKAHQFHALHRAGTPLVLFNVWDAGSAKAVAAAGAFALATGSASVAGSHGYADAEALPLALALANAARIVAATDLPVTLDFEGGYAVEPDALAHNTAAALAAGVIGFNFEDQIVGGTGLYATDVQAARLAAMRAACTGAGVDAFINARCDLFLKAPRASHDSALVDAAILRAEAYAAAGASGFFAPGLVHADLIEALCKACSLPVNIMMMPGVPDRPALAARGVARISHGPFPWRSAMANLEAEARAAMA